MAFRMGLLGKKLGMTQVFGADGERIPVTAVACGPCVVTAKRTLEKDKYTAIQLAFDEQKSTRLNKADLGNFAKANTTPKSFVQEIRLPEEECAKFEVGQTLTASDVFKAGVAIDVVGTSKGKGFQGVFKRHNLGGSRSTHGQHEFFRHGGSIGCRATPGKVHKGKRMAGRMGNERVAVLNCTVVKLDEEKGLIDRKSVV